MPEARSLAREKSREVSETVGKEANLANFIVFIIRFVI